MTPYNNHNNNKAPCPPVAQQSSTTSPVTTKGTATIGPSKEREPSQIVSAEAAAEIATEMEIPKEVEGVGLVKIKETIELPPDVKKLGVAPSGPSAPVVTITLPQVVLPISDQKVIVGLHVRLLNSLHWLATWCIRKLNKAHIALKVIHGKIIRVKI